MQFLSRLLIDRPVVKQVYFRKKGNGPGATKDQTNVAQESV